MAAVVQRFGHTPERRVILRGLLAYRSEFRAIGVTSGFQWLNGSFMQEVEVIEDRPPNDIDVVTYIALPEGESQRTLMARAPALFVSSQAKPLYHVDAYVLPFISAPCEAKVVERVTYWYSMWSHTRETNVWKGFVISPLDEEDDVAAQQMLDVLDQQEVAP